MASYITQSDVQFEAGGSERLIALTDYDRDGVADSDVVDNAIAWAESMLNSHAQRRFKVPFEAPIPDIVKHTAQQLAVLKLKERRGMLTDNDRLQYEAVMRWCAQLGNGEVLPGIAPIPDGGEAVVDAYNEIPDYVNLSREKLKGFW